MTAQRHDAQSHLSPNHASSVSVFFPSRGSPNGYIVARLLEKNRCLELRWLSLVQRAVGDVGETRGGVYDHLDAQAAVPPVRFQFADPLVPDVQLAEGDGTLIVHALSTAGILYRLKFTGPHFFATDELEEGYSSEYTVGGLSGRTPTLLHGVDTDAVIATCADGTAFLLQREDKHRSGDGAWH